MRPHVFAELSVTQTRMANLTVVILRADRVVSPGYDVLFDVASLQYVAEVVVDAGQEFAASFVSPAMLRLAGEP